MTPREWPCDPGNRVHIPFVPEGDPLRTKHFGWVEDDSVPIGWWHEESFDGSRRVNIRCPQGAVAALKLGVHTIDAAGNVNPSILVNWGPNLPQWHIFARLLDWKEAP